MSLARAQLLGIPGTQSFSQPPPPPAAAPAQGPSVMQQLEQLSTEQLEYLLSDDEEFKKFVSRHISELPATRALQDIQRRNQQLAQENLDMKDEIQQAKTHVAVVRSSEFDTARGTFAALQARQEAVLQVLAPGTIMQALNLDCDKADAKSEELQDKFMAGDMNAEAFVEQCLTQRTAYHVLDLKKQIAQTSLPGI